MAGQLEVATLIASLAVGLIAIWATASPATLGLAQRCYRHLHSYLWPTQSQCRRLLWTDIPDGTLISQVGSLMNTGQTRPAFIARKPFQLPLEHEYVQTDPKCLASFLMLSADARLDREKRNVEAELRIKAVSALLTVHFEASALRTPSSSLTKFELERMIDDGYPPFYRSVFTTTGGHTLTSPIENQSHTYRGAWVFAVGLTHAIGNVPWMHTMPRVIDENVEPYWKGTAVPRAFAMIGRTLSQLKTFEDAQHPPLHTHRDVTRSCHSSWSEHALGCYNMIINSKEYLNDAWIIQRQKIEDSKLFEPLVGECQCSYKCCELDSHSKTCRRGQHGRKDPAKDLTQEQCEAALEIFNNYLLSDEKLMIIYPVLLQVLQTVILGLSEVNRYFTRQGQPLDFPAVLKNRRKIYIRLGIDDDD